MRVSELVDSSIIVILVSKHIVHMQLGSLGLVVGVCAYYI